MNKTAKTFGALLMLGTLLAVPVLAEETPALRLPSGLRAIGDRAFYGDTSLRNIIIPDGTQSIGEEAFAKSSVELVTIPESVTTIAENAFDDAPSAVIKAPEGSAADQYAYDHNLVVYGAFAEPTLGAFDADTCVLRIEAADEAAGKLLIAIGEGEAKEIAIESDSEGRYVTLPYADFQPLTEVACSVQIPATEAMRISPAAKTTVKRNPQAVGTVAAVWNTSGWLDVSWMNADPFCAYQIYTDDPTASGYDTELGAAKLCTTEVGKSSTSGMNVVPRFGAHKYGVRLIYDGQETGDIVWSNSLTMDPVAKLVDVQTTVSIAEGVTVSVEIADWKDYSLPTLTIEYREEGDTDWTARSITCGRDETEHYTIYPTKLGTLQYRVRIQYAQYSANWYLGTDNGHHAAGDEGTLFSATITMEKYTAKDAQGNAIAWYSIEENDDDLVLVLEAYLGSESAVEIPSTIGSLPVVGIAENAFAYNSTLTSVSIPDSVTSIGSGAFSGCTALTSASMPFGIDTGDIFVDIGSVRVGRKSGTRLNNTWGDTSDIQAGDFVWYGSYPQTADGDELPIEWIALDVKDGQAFLISLYGLEGKAYYEPFSYNVHVEWNISTLRNWLNGTFMDKAFSETEKAKIALTTVDNSASQGFPDWSKTDKPNTEDYLYVLSYQEYITYFGEPTKGGSGEENYNTKARTAPTPYALANGALAHDSYLMDEALYGDDAACGMWWLRSESYEDYKEYPGTRINVHYTGDINAHSVDSANCCVRPVFWLKMD